MILPPGALGPGATRAMLALLRVHARDGRATVLSVASEAQRGNAVTHQHLIRLERAGLVTGLGTRGGLRPTVQLQPR